MYSLTSYRYVFYWFLQVCVLLVAIGVCSVSCYMYVLVVAIGMCSIGCYRCVLLVAIGVCSIGCYGYVFYWLL